MPSPTRSLVRSGGPPTAGSRCSGVAGRGAGRRRRGRRGPRRRSARRPTQSARSSSFSRSSWSRQRSTAYATRSDGMPARSGPPRARIAWAVARVSSSRPAISADIENGGRMPWSFGARCRTIARNSSRAGVEGSWSGPISSTARSCCSGASRSRRSSSSSTGVIARRIWSTGSASAEARTASAVIRPAT